MLSPVLSLTVLSAVVYIQTPGGKPKNNGNIVKNWCGEEEDGKQKHYFICETVILHTFTVLHLQQFVLEHSGTCLTQCCNLFSGGCPTILTPRSDHEMSVLFAVSYLSDSTGLILQLKY